MLGGSSPDRESLVLVCSRLIGRLSLIGDDGSSTRAASRSLREANTTSSNKT